MFRDQPSCSITKVTTDRACCLNACLCIICSLITPSCETAPVNSMQKGVMAMTLIGLKRCVLCRKTADEIQIRKAYRRLAMKW